MPFDMNPLNWLDLIITNVKVVDRSCCRKKEKKVKYVFNFLRNLGLQNRHLRVINTDRTQRSSVRLDYYVNSQNKIFTSNKSYKE